MVNHGRRELSCRDSMKAETSFWAISRPTNLANSATLVVACPDDFRDESLHRQLTVKVNAEVANGLLRKISRQNSNGFSSSLTSN